MKAILIYARKLLSNITIFLSIECNINKTGLRVSPCHSTDGQVFRRHAEIIYR